VVGAGAGFAGVGTAAGWVGPPQAESRRTAAISMASFDDIFISAPLIRIETNFHGGMLLFGAPQAAGV
jgi:hypothetical protein